MKNQEVRINLLSQRLEGEAQNQEKEKQLQSWGSGSGAARQPCWVETITVIGTSLVVRGFRLCAPTAKKFEFNPSSEN